MRRRSLDLLLFTVDPRAMLIADLRAMLERQHRGAGWPDHGAHVAWFKFAQVCAIVGRPP